ncbi:hypothetical protein, partial [Tenebrionibacter intestinalis]|uniref:hypothetical protein n=1 Tax=Tenebrionibacter intestinalis TaxID=2799638 RepID=UPI001EE9981F
FLPAHYWGFLSALAGLFVTQVLQLLCVSFCVSSLSGRCPAENANFFFFRALSLSWPIKIAGGV